MPKRPRGPVHNWQPSTDRQRRILADLTARYAQHQREGTAPRGPRGIFYDLRPEGPSGMRYTKSPPKVPGARGKVVEGYAGPDQVSEVLTLARRAGLISERLVADSRSAPGAGLFYDDDPQDAVDHVLRTIEGAAAGFGLDPQTYQAIRLEIWCEAHELIDRVAVTAEPLGVPVHSGSGYDSLKLKRRVAGRVATSDVPIRILHIGDCDLHGERIFEAFSEDVEAWVRFERSVAAEDDDDIDPDTRWLDVERIALTEEQAEELGLLDDDGKAEADGMPVPYLDELVREAIDRWHVPARREQVEREQEEQRALIPGMVEEGLRRLRDADDDG